MTHILISLEDFNDLIDKAKGLETVIFLGLVKSRGKQISLTKEEIEDKAKAFAKTGKVSGKFGYRQALKDLL